MWMAGYAARKGPSEGKVHDLWAKALVLEDGQGGRFVLVAVDLIGIPRPTRDWMEKQVEERFKLPPERLLLNASHTHCGPVVRETRYSIYGNTLYGLSPVFELRPPGKLVLERLDQRGERHELAVTGQELMRGGFFDCAKAGVVLAPGGIYRAKFADRQIVFKIDPDAKPGDAPLLGRLARLRAWH